MQIKFFLLAILFISFIRHNPSYSKQTFSQSQTNDKIKKMIILDSIAAYPKKCPCPYNVTKNGSRCEKRSAYSKPGGEAPICYPIDVTLKMIEDYKRKMDRKNPLD